MVLFHTKIFALISAVCQIFLQQWLIRDIISTLIYRAYKNNSVFINFKAVYFLLQGLGHIGNVEWAFFLVPRYLTLNQDPQRSNGEEYYFQGCPAGNDFVFHMQLSKWPLLNAAVSVNTMLMPRPGVVTPLDSPVI